MPTRSCLKMMLPLTFLLLNLLACVSPQSTTSCQGSGDVAGGLLRLLSGLDWRDAALVSDRPAKHARLVWRATSHHHIGITWLKPSSVFNSATFVPGVRLVYLTDKPFCREETLQLISLNMPQHRLIVVTGEMEKDINTCLSTVNKSRAFFISDIQTWSLSRIQIFSSHQIVRNAWPYDVKSCKFNKAYNLQKASVSMLTLSWMPWLSIYDCDPKGKNCNSFGILREVFDILAHLYNFTYSIDREDHNDWGVVPKNGSYFDANPTFSGVLGATVYGYYDVAASLWAHTLGRDLWLDLTMRWIQLTSV